MYDKSNVMEQSFSTEINKLISVYVPIEFFNEKRRNEKIQTVSFINPLKFTVLKGTIKNVLDFQILKNDENLPKINN